MNIILAFLGGMIAAVVGLIYHAWLFVWLRR